MWYIYCMEKVFNKNCTLCPRNCNVDRSSKVGYCNVGQAPVVARAGLHLYEEPCISGKNGSGAVFFSGCNMGCVFCQNRQISKAGIGKAITVSRLAEIFAELEAQGAETINLVTPTHFVPQICEALSLHRPGVPLIYNTSAYEKVETLEMIAPFVDVYLPDYKYADGDLAQKYSACHNYPEVALNAIEYMINQRPRQEFNDRGIMTCGVIVRHLVMPGATDNSVKALQNLAKFKGKFLLSLMSQYTPFEGANAFPELSRRITRLEYKRVLAYAEHLGLTDGFMQELSSATEDYVPDFDLTGV